MLLGAFFKHELYTNSSVISALDSVQVVSYMVKSNAINSLNYTPMSVSDSFHNETSISSDLASAAFSTFLLSPTSKNTVNAF